MIDLFTEVADQNPGEQDGRRAEANAPDFDTAERHSHYADECQNTDRVRDGLRLVEIEEPAHTFTSRR
jgi:hypothetical protein